MEVLYMKKKMGPVIAGLFLIIVIILILVISKKIEKYIPSEEMADLGEYYGVTSDEDVAVVWNQELSDIIVKKFDGQIYLTLDQLKDRLNDRFYYDRNEQLLIYTTAETNIKAYAGKSEYYIGNEATAVPYEIVKTVDGEIYVALDYIQKYTDLAYELVEKPNRLILWTDFDTGEPVSIKKETQLRVKGGIKSPILKELEKDEELILLEQMDDWSKLMTMDGIIGYAKNKHITFDDASLVPKEETLTHSYEGETFTHNLLEEPVNLLWHQVVYQEANSRIASVLASSKGVNVVAPTWFYLNDNEGNIADKASSNYVSICHEQGVKVWGLVSNLENKEADTSYVLSHTTTRENLVHQILTKALQYNLDGVNLDFESIDSAVGDDYIQFVRELSLKCRANNLILSVDNYVPTEYTAFYDRTEQANYADYIVIMAYDEHYSGSGEGSVASIDYVKNGVKNTIAQSVPAEQIILGVPFYTRLWKEVPKEDESDTVESASADYVGYELSSESLGMAETRRRVEANGATMNWLDDMCQYYAQYEHDGATYKVWMEDAKSIEKKLEVMTDNKLAGAAFWKAGLETADVWDVIVAAMQKLQ